MVEEVEGKESANKWLVVVGLIVVGLLIGGGLVFAGYKLTQQKVPEFEEFEKEISTPRPEAGRPLDETPTPTVPAASPSAEEETEEPETTEEENPFEGWETYTNTAYGYQFMHPAGWSFSIDVTNEDPGTALYVIRQGITSNNVDDYTVAVRAWDNPDELSLGDWLEFMKDSNALPLPVEDMDLIPNTEVGGEEALQFWSDPLSGGAEPGECVQARLPTPDAVGYGGQACPVLSVYVVHGDRAYVVNLNYLREFDEDSYILFSQVLSTFEFL
jgi:hypothetical protein